MSSQSTLRAIFIALAGFTCWVIGDSFLKLAGELLHAKYQVMLLGGFGGMLSIGGMAAVRGKLSTLRVHKPKTLALLGFLFLANYGVWLTALSRLPLANFYAVIFLAPTTASLFAAWILKEQLTIPKLLATIAGFIGVVIAVDPTNTLSERQNWVGYGIAFIGMFVAVAQMLVLRIVGTKETREATAFYPRFAAIGTALICIILFGWEPMSAQAIIFSLLTGAIGGIGWMFIAQAYQLAPAATVAPFMYSEIISGGLIGYFVWHDVPSMHLLMGAAIIIASGFYIMTHAARAERRAKIIVDTP
ncbi:MAG TPA: DMT family transporter [Alphaproteobacteria bacterium]|nr:DMT family transporter [Alphaproteobacteria bacterium]